MDITQILAALASKRPLFHSEADFQHALAWEIHTSFPDSKIRLEYRPAGLDRMYVDLWVSMPDATTLAVELKYKTRGFVFDHAGEPHELLNQGAQDLGRYDFLRDLLRLELVTRTIPAVQGIAILLTNDSSYWAAPKSEGTVDAPFRLHEGRMLTGRLGWGRGASAGTMRSREKPIVLSGNYEISWSKYSELDLKKGVFRYALVNVSAKS